MDSPAPTTKDLLTEAAAAEFRERGFQGTDSNKIARRAGFAPQTFYRWFKDKTEVFVAVYRLWEDEERRFIGELVRQGAGEAAIVEAAVKHHRDYLHFRRSLRRLSLEDPEVRQARAQSRLRQVERLHRHSGSGLTREEIAVRLLELERLSDALAEGELADMGLDEAAARRRLVEILAEMR
ncbi:TetR/AcrR family transcriptional regulator [Phenylobacterium montanum]|uniref:TetR/AcrR family transcriptional regulator n=1 Tax=Phenylobacterium montanum TaxID=2823693 RepID=A0A975FXX6_9CAUL|nr:TetR/AcrR family transcriptional regulator [Caulobacter sp. S6]QUD87009.1 TetR/AcrR family transcriptional regulator [Caulobacter sp. S6]